MGTVGTGLSPGRRRALDALVAFIAARGFPPTCAELGAKLDISARGAHDHLIALEKAGYIEREYWTSRAIRVLKTE